MEWTDLFDNNEESEKIEKEIIFEYKTKDSFLTKFQLLKIENEQENFIFDKYGFTPVINILTREMFILTYKTNLTLELLKEKEKEAIKLLKKYNQNNDKNIIIVQYSIFFEIKEQYSIIDKEYNESEARNFYKDLLTDASRKHASDIHLTWMTDYISIRYRLDGILVLQPKKIDLNLGTALKNIFVNLAGESEYQQNEVAGQYVEYIDNVKTEYRLSIGPTVQGHVIVIRIEHKIDKNANLEGLSYSPKAIEMIRKLFLEKYGLVLVTGQTGSGKSTLMYTSAVERLYNDPIRIPQILTAEDPVEMVVDGRIKYK